MPAKIVRDVLIADASVSALVADKIGPAIEQQDQTFPYVVLSVVNTEPQNDLQGFSNLDRNEVQVDAWDFTYKNAQILANACRNAMQLAGYICIAHINDNFDFSETLGAFRIGFVFQVWK